MALQSDLNFNEWVKSVGDIESKGITLAAFDGGLRGIAATEKLESGIKMTIPADLALEVTNNR